jgi:calcineurin-like phosphoesterase family protein
MPNLPRQRSGDEAWTLRRHARMDAAHHPAAPAQRGAWRIVGSDAKMSHNRFFVSDTHFWDQDHAWVRGFASVEAMNEHIIARWNDVVRHGDRVYHLGDVSAVYGHRLRSVMRRLRGCLELLAGNHDDLGELAPYFDEVRLWRVFPRGTYGLGFLASHVPQKRDVFPDAVRGNAHGHLHGDVVLRDGAPDPRYANVCVDHTNYRPTPLEEIIQRIGEVRDDHHHGSRYA